MRIQIVLCLFALGLARGADAQSIDTTSAIDTTLTRILDVTADGKADTIFLHLKARNLGSPFSWALWINSDGRLIYSWREDDTRIDTLFHDEGYVANCRGYLDCKRNFYFHDILSDFVVSPSMYNLEGILDRSRSNTLYALGKTYLQWCGIGDREAETILSGMEQRLRNGTAVVLAVPATPQTPEPPMVFAPEIGRFVPIYQE